MKTIREIHNWSECKYNDYVWCLIPSGLPTTGLTHLRVKDHWKKGGRNIVGAADHDAHVLWDSVFCILQRCLSHESQQYDELNKANIITVPDEKLTQMREISQGSNHTGKTTGNQ